MPLLRVPTTRSGRMFPSKSAMARLTGHRVPVPKYWEERKRGCQFALAGWLPSMIAARETVRENTRTQALWVKDFG